jgi:hypothetical protein
MNADGIFLALLTDKEERTMKISLSAKTCGFPLSGPAIPADRHAFPPPDDGVRSGPVPGASLEALAESDAVRGMEERYAIREEGLF